MYSITVSDDSKVSLHFDDGVTKTTYTADHVKVNSLLSTEARKMVETWDYEGRPVAKTAGCLLSFVDIRGLGGVAWRIVAADLAARLEDFYKNGPRFG